MPDMPAANWPPSARGYFAIGAERMSKALNLGNLMRSAHGFGASFTFTVGATYRALEAHADTSKSQLHVPHYNWPSLEDMALPQGCKLVGVELIDNAIDLPSFRTLTGRLRVRPRARLAVDKPLARCDHAHPDQLCINVAMAGAIVMYDRTRPARLPSVRRAKAAPIPSGPEERW
jgi:hypothetical protein